MSEATKPFIRYSYDPGDMVEDRDGDMVSLADYLALRAENERIKTVLKNLIDCDNGHGVCIGEGGQCTEGCKAMTAALRLITT